MRNAIVIAALCFVALSSCTTVTPELSNAGDFSRSSIEPRIRVGYQDAIDAMNQGIGDVDAPGLRFGATAADPERVGAMG